MIHDYEAQNDLLDAGVVTNTTAMKFHIEKELKNHTNTA